jgi:hypothetical protein
LIAIFQWSLSTICRGGNPGTGSVIYLSVLTENFPNAGQEEHQGYSDNRTMDMDLPSWDLNLVEEMKIKCTISSDKCYELKKKDVIMGYNSSV